jgi:hypothetical protein
MEYFFPISVSSLTTLLLQSATVPNTSKTSASTSERTAWLDIMIFSMDGVAFIRKDQGKEADSWNTEEA